MDEVNKRLSGFAAELEAAQKSVLFAAEDGLNQAAAAAEAQKAVASRIDLDRIASQIDAARPPHDYSLAGAFYRQLHEYFSEMKETQEKDESIDVAYCPGSGERITVTDLDYQNPHLIIVHGVDSDGNQCRALAHMASVQLVIKVIKLKKTEERRPIGFLSPVPPLANIVEKGAKENSE